MFGNTLMMVHGSSWILLRTSVKVNGTIDAKYWNLIEPDMQPSELTNTLHWNVATKVGPMYCIWHIYKYYQIFLNIGFDLNLEADEAYWSTVTLICIDMTPNSMAVRQTQTLTHPSLNIPTYWIQCGMPWSGSSVNFTELQKRQFYLSIEFIEFQASLTSSMWWWWRCRFVRTCQQSFGSFSRGPRRPQYVQHVFHFLDCILYTLIHFTNYLYPKAISFWGFCMKELWNFPASKIWVEHGERKSERLPWLKTLSLPIVLDKMMVV